MGVMKSSFPFQIKGVFPTFILAGVAALIGAFVAKGILPSEPNTNLADQVTNALNVGEALFVKGSDQLEITRLEESTAVLTRDIRAIEQSIAALRSQSANVTGKSSVQHGVTPIIEKVAGEQAEAIVGKVSEVDGQKNEDPAVELEEILAEKSNDPSAVATLDTFQGALDAIAGTSVNVLSTKCSESVCRVDFQHQSDLESAAAQRDLILKLNWDATYILKTGPVPGSFGMLESTLYVDKRPPPPGV